MSRDTEQRQLNEEYVRASLAGEVKWYRTHLAEEFVRIDSDGLVLEKLAILSMTAKGSELAEYRAGRGQRGFYGDVALVRAQGPWTAKNGTPGVRRYVDVHARTAAEWNAVSAQITRPTP